MGIEKAARLLAKCEADLRTLVGAAAESGDYDAALRITSWAKQLSAMTNGASLPSQHALRSAQNSTPRGAYPRFSRRGDQLVKIGWSKREKSEYEHKAPRRAVLILSGAAASAGKDGRIFQINSIMPLTDPEDGSEFPEYQIYIVIAWWRSAGLLDQHGRQGYSIPNPSQLQQAVEWAWTKLLEE